MKSNFNLVGLAVLAGIASLSLAGCSGGGGGGVTPPPDTGGYVPNTPSQPAKPTNSARVTISTDYNGAPAKSVGVAVLDSGINPTHQEFTDNGGKNGVGGQIITGGLNVSQDIFQNVLGSSPQSSAYDTGRSVDDYTWHAGDSPHGNNVASIIAGSNIGYSGNASLFIEQITSGSTANANVLSYALGDAATRGASFANVSYEYDPVASYAIAKSNIAAGQQGFPDIALQKAVDNGLGVIVSAGNSSVSFSEANNTKANWTSDNPMLNQTLIVGALGGANSDQLAAYSDYAGEDPLVQSRFLVAPGTNMGADPTSNTGYGEFTGTSSATPVVTAAAATLKAYWSFMTPAQVEQRLLDTADKNFNALWSQNTCGASGTMNCGSYYFGQGRLDLKAALAPAGVVVTSTGASVPTGVSASSAPVQATSLSVPASMSSIQKQVQAASVGVQGFDSIGRNYTLNLAPSIGTSVDPTQALGNKMGGLMGSFMSKGSTSFTSFDQQ